MKILGDQLTKRVGNALQYKSGDALVSELSKAVAYYLKSSGTTNKELVKGIIRSSIPSVLLGGKDVVDNLINKVQVELN